jgi:signal transduction histidine kinase
MRTRPWFRQKLWTPGLVVGGLGITCAAVFASGLLSAHQALLFSNLSYAPMQLAAALVIFLAARRLEGRARLAWSLIAIGVAVGGLGQAAWSWYELGPAGEVPYPGLPDIFYLGTYPLVAAGLWAMPRLPASRYQKARHWIDIVIVTSGLGLWGWISLLQPIYEASSGASVAEMAVGLGYPLGDMLLIASAVLLGGRRSMQLHDWRLWALTAALAAYVAGDVVYLVHTWYGSYVSGTWLDATWMVAFGLFALTGAGLGWRLPERQPQETRLPRWQLATPYVVLTTILALFVAKSLTRADSPHDLLVDIGFAFLSMCVIGRLAITTAEDRHLVDVERRQLISVVSHELRTPLTAISGFLQLTTDGWHRLPDHERLEMVTTAEEQTRQLNRIVTDLVQASRDRLHDTTLSLGTVDLAHLTWTVASAVHLENAVLQQDVPHLSVVADRERLTQVLNNLITNAGLYGGGSVLCRAERVDGHITFEVHDDGAGVPPRFEQLIWSRFERGAHRFDAASPGSGLGLAIVRSLVQAHGGRVGYRRSELLGGACFWFTLPALQVKTHHRVAATS